MNKLLRDAVQAGSVEDIIFAVQQGADVNARDDSGETALTLATAAELGPDRAKACVRCLLGLGARVSEERPNRGLGTSVHGAAAYGFEGALKDLLAADGKVSLNTFDDMSRTPLMCAVQNAHLAEASILLEAGADVNAHDVEKIGNTALSDAVDNWNLAMVELLLRFNADPTIQGWMQLSALDRARDWDGADAPLEGRQIWELVSEAAKRRTPPGKVL